MWPVGRTHFLVQVVGVQILQRRGKHSIRNISVDERHALPSLQVTVWLGLIFVRCVTVTTV